MEVDLLSCALKSRSSFDNVSKFIDIKQYSREFQHLIKYVADYYKRDSDADHVKTSLLLEYIKASVENDKHVERFKEYLDRAEALDTSAQNTEAVILESKRRELEISLAVALSDGAKKDLNEQWERYRELCSATSLEALSEEEDVEIINAPSLTSLLSAREKYNVIPLYPKAINEKVDGGVERGDNIILYGPTEIGKSLLAINNACGWARLGLRTLYIINEDKASRIATRMASNLTGMTRKELEANPEHAQELLDTRGFGNIILVQLVPGNPQQIDSLIEKYKVDCVVVDQLRNITTSTKNNKVIQLEEAATAARNLGKKHNVLMFNVTQAGDSARNKIFLDNGDVDFSNVGIPGQADLMIGFGADQGMLGRNERGISLAKNKISGDHSQFIIRVNPFLSRAMSV
jgi:archaellum biogenesis ATPase FlaH